MKKTLPFFERRRQRHKSGSLLISMIVLLTIIGLLATTLTDIVGSSAQSRVVHTRASRAYLLAESGAAYFHQQRTLNAYVLPRATFTLDGGDQFYINSVRLDHETTKVTSTGIYHPGQTYHMMRTLTFIVKNPPLPNNVLPLGFDFNEDHVVDNTWTFSGLANPWIQQPYRRGALFSQVVNTEGHVTMTWQNDPEIDFVQYWTTNGNRLDYEAQVKLGDFIRGGVKWRRFHFLTGISFRLSPDTNSSYGLSFFQSRLVDELNRPIDPPAWVPDAWSFLRGPQIHLLLWHRTDATTFNLLARRTLTPADQMTYTIAGAELLKTFASLAVGMEEQVDAMGNRANHIRAYFAPPEVYPVWSSVLDMEWPEDGSVFSQPVVWDTPATNVVIDTSLTSAGFGASPTSEISLHVLSDFDGSETLFFVHHDFAMREAGNVAQIPPTIQY